MTVIHTIPAGARITECTPIADGLHMEYEHAGSLTIADIHVISETSVRVDVATRGPDFTITVGTSP